MKVKMILRQIGEHGHRVGRSGHPPERQGMTGHLHRGRCDSAFGHHGEGGLQVGGFRGGQLARGGAARHAGLHAADKAGQVASHPETGLDQVGGGGLAAGAGHADQLQPGGRIPVDPGRHLAQPRPRIGDHEHRQPASGREIPAVRIGQYRHGACFGRLPAEQRAVQAAPWQRGVQVTAPDPA